MDTRGHQYARAAGQAEEAERWITAALEQDLDLTKAVIQVFLRCTLLPGGYLDRRANTVERAMRESNSGSVLYTRWVLLVKRVLAEARRSF